MNFGKILFCPWDSLSKITEEQSIKQGLSIGLYDEIPTNTGFQKVSLMIFIRKSGITEYQVLVLKSNKNDRYVKLPQDNFTRYEEDDEAIAFYFYCYFSAHHFADVILPLHTEFSDRPVGLIP